MQHIIGTDLLEPGEVQINESKLAALASRNSLQLKFARPLKLWSIGEYKGREPLRREFPVLNVVISAKQRKDPVSTL